MGITSDFWHAFIAAFRAEKQGGEAAKASREHTDNLRRELRDERESRRIAKRWVKAKTPLEQRETFDEVIKHVLDEPEKLPSSSPSPAVGHELTDDLPWSSNPGAHESHLARRHDNPYFPEPRRTITREELQEAIRADGDELHDAEQRFHRIVEEVEALPSNSTIGELMEIREEIDHLIHFSMSVGGSAKGIASEADQLREAVISTAREAFADDNENLAVIEEADSYHRDQVGKFSIPFVAQLLRQDEIIPDEDLIPSVLSEDPVTISIILDVVPEEVSANVRISALEIMKQALDEGYKDPEFKEKLTALSDST